MDSNPPTARDNKISQVVPLPPIFQEQNMLKSMDDNVYKDNKFEETMPKRGTVTGSRKNSIDMGFDKNIMIISQSQIS